MGFARSRALGDGSYGQVCVLHALETGEEFAGKLFDKGDDGFLSQETVVEIEFLTRAAGHPNIVRLVELTFDLEGYEGIAVGVLPLYPRSLSNVVECGLPKVLRLLAARGLLAGLAWLHCRRPSIVHRDVKPENVLLSQEGEAVLCDFSFATWHPRPQIERSRPRTRERRPATEGSRERAAGVCGTTGYIAPELFSDEMAMAPANDAYSAGVTLLELFMGARVKAVRDRAAIREVNDFRERLGDHPAARLLKSLTEPSPASRATTREAARHETFEGMEALVEVDPPADEDPLAEASGARVPDEETARRVDTTARALSYGRSTVAYATLVLQRWPETPVVVALQIAAKTWEGGGLLTWGETCHALRIKGLAPGLGHREAEEEELRVFSKMHRSRFR